MPSTLLPGSTIQACSASAVSKIPFSDTQRQRAHGSRPRSVAQRRPARTPRAELQLAVAHAADGLLARRGTLALLVVAGRRPVGARAGQSEALETTGGDPAPAASCRCGTAPRCRLRCKAGNRRAASGCRTGSRDEVAEAAHRRGEAARELVPRRDRSRAPASCDGGQLGHAALSPPSALAMSRPAAGRLVEGIRSRPQCAPTRSAGCDQESMCR